MKSNGNYDWKFSTLGGVTRVNIATGQDIAHLDELDQKLWTVLSSPVSGLEMEPETLSIIDSDKDGQIHVNEVVAAAKWLTSVLKDADTLVKAGDELAFNAFNEESEEGKALLECARQIVAASGEEKDSITLADASAYLDLISKKPFNGDGIITPAATEDEALKQTITDAIACAGSVTDRSGEAGIDADKVEAFYTAVADYCAWVEAGDADKDNVFPYGADTASALAAVNAIKAKVDDYFLRCRLAAFNSTDASLDVSADKITEISTKNLSACVDEIAEYPLAKVSASQTLSLTEGINPAWQAAVASFKALVLDADAAELTEDQWNAVQAKFGAYTAWLGTKKGECVEALGADRAKAILAADQKAAILDLIAQDKALEGSVASVESVRKLLILNRDFFTFIRNFVTFDDFYASVDGKTKAIFQAGTLYIDQRSTDLCIKVADMGKQGDMAALSGMFILYCACTSKSKGQSMNIAAVLTEGQITSLRVGQNAVFYDRQGAEWDAVVTKIVDNPISVKQAFMSPYRRFARTISDRIKKSVADKEAKVTGDVTSKAGAISVPTTAEQAEAAKAAAPAKPGFDIAKFACIFASVGMAAGFLGAALAALVKPWYTILIVLGVLVICISGPSMIMTWLKLKKRNIGPILNANGWAINSKALVNARFGSFFTHLVKLPKVKGKDPLADRTPLWKKFLCWLVAIALILGAAWFICPKDKRPFCKPEPVEAADTTCCCAACDSLGATAPADSVSAAEVLPE